MPDPWLYLQSLAGAAVSAALAPVIFSFITHSVMARIGGKLRRPATNRAANGAAVLGTGVGLAVGFWLLELPLTWPPTNGLGRLLTVVLPAAVGVELLASGERFPRWLAWSLRSGLAWATGRVLLHRSVYLSGQQIEWTGWQAALALSLGGGVLLAEWVLLAALQVRSPGVSLPLALGQACLAAGMCVMLEGYLAGGEAALPLAGALAGVAIASVRVPSGAPAGAVGIGVVGLFSLLLIGRFFGGLSNSQAAAIFLAPLLCWVTEIGVLPVRSKWLVALLRLALVAAPLLVVLTLAKRDFDCYTVPLLSEGGGVCPNVKLVAHGHSL